MSLCIQVMIVDDHAVVRQGTQLLLEHPLAGILPPGVGFKVVATGDNAENLLPVFNQHTLDILLLDLNLGESFPSGLDALATLGPLRPQWPQLKIVLFSAYLEAPYIQKALKLGADGYLSKTITAEELQKCLWQVAQNTHLPVLSRDAEAALAHASKVQPSKDEGLLKSLSPRELEILLHVAKGLTNRQIGDTLFVAVKTVDTHVANLIKKLNVKNRAQLTAWAYENHLV